jgi:hypothetical protein
MVAGGEALSGEETLLLSVPAQLGGTVIAKLELIAAERSTARRMATLSQACAGSDAVPADHLAAGQPGRRQELIGRLRTTRRAVYHDAPGWRWPTRAPASPGSSRSLTGPGRERHRSCRVRVRRDRTESGTGPPAPPRRGRAAQPGGPQT